MYADRPCELCEDDDGMVRWYQGTKSVALCYKCNDKAEELDGYSHHFVQDKCHACGHATGPLKLVKYKADDKYKGKKVKQCAFCHDFFTSVEKLNELNACSKCHKMVLKGMHDDKINDTCECGRKMKKSFRHLPSGRIVMVMECWYCDRESEPVTIATKVHTRPPKVNPAF